MKDIFFTDDFILIVAIQKGFKILNEATKMYCRLTKNQTIAFFLLFKKF